MPSAVRVFGTVNGRPARLVVDTCLERTFVRENMVDAVGMPEATQLFCGVTGVGLGDVMERLPVSRADL